MNKVNQPPWSLHHGGCLIEELTVTNRRGETVRLTNRDWFKMCLILFSNVAVMAMFVWSLHEDIAVLKVEMTAVKQEQKTVKNDIRDVRTMILRNFEVLNR